MLVANSKQSISSQIDFDEKLLESVVSKSLGKSKVLENRYLSYAYTNKTILMRFDDGTKVVVKVSVKEDRYPKLALEIELIERLLKDSKIPVPAILFKDLEMKEFPYPFVIYSFLDGTNLVDAIDEIQDKGEVGVDLAWIAFELHKFDYPEPKFSLASKGQAQSWKQIITETCENGLKTLKDNNYERLSELEKWVTNHISLVVEPKQYSLIHRDLQPQNIHWNIQEKRIQGVFDFESAMSGDFYFEFNFLERNLFKTYPEIKKSFYEAYNKHTPLRKDYDRLVLFYEVVRDLYFYPRDIKYGELDRANGDIESIERLVLHEFNVG